jgi:hypothetical protein
MPTEKHMGVAIFPHREVEGCQQSKEEGSSKEQAGVTLKRNGCFAL